MGFYYKLLLLLLFFFFFYFLGLLINLGYQLLNKNLNKTHVSFYSEKKKKKTVASVFLLFALIDLNIQGGFK